MFNLLIIGRANVGKSTLCNALLGYRRSIIYDEPGTTRDIVMGKANWGKGEFCLFDTQGVFDESDVAWLGSELKKASACLLVVDAGSGPTPFDQLVVRAARLQKVPVLLVINKCDKPDAYLSEDFAGLGVGEIVEVSAAHRRSIDQVKAWALERQPDRADILEGAEPIHLAIVGRPNTGKSTLLNRLARSKVSRVSPTALTTRDPVYCDISFKGQSIRLIDTAGVRRPRSQMEAIEALSVQASTKTIERADVVFLCVASDEGVTDQDLRLLSLIERKKKPVAILFNFWDRLSREEQRRVWQDRAHPVRNFEALPVSGKTGYNLSRLLTVATALSAGACKRFSTAEVNKVVRSIVERNPPPVRGSRTFNILYTSQVKTQPPTFVFFMNRKAALPGSYRRFLENELRKRFRFSSQPIQLFFRTKSQAY